MTTSRSGFARMHILSLAMLTIAGCSAPDPARREGWPLSEIEVSVEPTEDQDAAGSMDAIAVDSTAAIRELLQNPHIGGPDDAVGFEDGKAVAEVSTSAEQEPRAPTPYRPPMDMDLSGPMIHTRPDAQSDFPDARFPRPEHVRGLYVNAWAAGSSSRMGDIIDLVRRTEVNSLVIDIKDATGYLSHETSIPLSLEIGAAGERRIRDLPGLLDRLEVEGIYPIARIVVVKDPLLGRIPGLRGARHGRGCVDRQQRHHLAEPVLQGSVGISRAGRSRGRRNGLP